MYVLRQRFSIQILFQFYFTNMCVLRHYRQVKLLISWAKIITQMILSTTCTNNYFGMKQSNIIEYPILRNVLNY